MGTSKAAVYVWASTTGELLHRFDAPPKLGTGSITGLAISPKGDRVAVGNWIGALTLWEPKEGARIATLAEGGIIARATQFSADGEILIGGVSDGAVRRWSAATGAPVAPKAPQNPGVVPGMGGSSSLASAGAPSRATTLAP